MRDSIDTNPHLHEEEQDGQPMISNNEENFNNSTVNMTKKFNSLMDLNKEGQTTGEVVHKTQSYEELMSAEDDGSEPGEALDEIEEAPLHLRVG